MPFTVGLRLPRGLRRAHREGQNRNVDHRLFLAARSRVLADLSARRQATPDMVSVLEDAVAARRWWAEQWPEGEIYVAGLVAQDVQDAAIDAGNRWPLCLSCPGADTRCTSSPTWAGRTRCGCARSRGSRWRSWAGSVSLAELDPPGEAVGTVDRARDLDDLVLGERAARLAEHDAAGRDLQQLGLGRRSPRPR